MFNTSVMSEANIRRNYADDFKVAIKVLCGTEIIEQNYQLTG
jgi:hypothetical protein